MLPTFVIGLREGLEAALIVGIIAAFLRKQGRRDLIRWVFAGVGIAVVLCVGAGVALNVLSKDLPQRQQEGLETVIGALAVGMVTYMVVWMKRHSRDLKGQLEGLAQDAMTGTDGAGRAMVVMAFLAVLREGVETVVFLLAVFNNTTSGSSAALGACLGIASAVVLGYGIYRGGVHINLSKFFRATGIVLVFVAAGIVVNALRTAHEAGWLNVGQSGTVDLTWLVRPGSVQSSLLTGMLGVQSQPVLIEVVGWLVYLIPVGIYVVWPPGKGLARRTMSRLLLAVGAALAVATAVVALVRPSAPATSPATDGNRVVSATGGTLVVLDRLGQAMTLHATGSAARDGVTTTVYTGRTAGAAARDLPSRIPYSRVAELNGGHLPFGLTATGHGLADVRYAATVTTTAWIEPGTHRLIDLSRAERVTATVVDPSRGSFPLAAPVRTDRTALPRESVTAAASGAAHDLNTIDRRDTLAALAWTVGVLAVVVLLAAGGLAFGPRRRQDARATSPALVEDLARS